jgi:release factor glutamine methyltransferase
MSAPATVQSALMAAIVRLREGGIADSALDARHLMAYALGVAASRLTLHSHDALSAHAAATFQAYVDARLGHQPVAQIIGRRAFYGREFIVTKDVLDPRPDTETLIEKALSAPYSKVLDLGTGSGCILITLLAENPVATGEGVDLSAAALAVAQQNANACGVSDRATFYRSDWLSGATGPYDLIVSNPPYIAEDEMAGLARDVRDWEPHIALTPGADGLKVYRALSVEAAQFLTKDGRMVVEIGAGQGPDVVALFEQAFWSNVALFRDINGRDRVVCAQKSPAQVV